MSNKVMNVHEKRLRDYNSSTGYSFGTLKGDDEAVKWAIEEIDRLRSENARLSAENERLLIALDKSWSRRVGDGASAG